MPFLAVGMVVFISTGHVTKGPDVTQSPSIEKETVEVPIGVQQQGRTSRSPASQAKLPQSRRWMTEAVMTNHTLTASHFIDRHELEQLLADNHNRANQG